jgi:hypothetical protein
MIVRSLVAALGFITVLSTLTLVGVLMVKSLGASLGGRLGRRDPFWRGRQLGRAPHLWDAGSTVQRQLHDAARLAGHQRYPRDGSYRL